MAAPVASPASAPAPQPAAPGTDLDADSDADTDADPVRPPTLRGVRDDEPGLRREPHDPGDLRAGFRVLDVQGREVHDEATLARVRRLAIPPAWTEVWICATADGHLQATGRDARGRKQYRYHAAWQAGRGQTKFDALLRFGQVLPQIRERVARALAGPDEPTRSRVLATLVRLLDATGLRIGNAAYARENGSFGLSTLRNRHARVDPAQGDVRLSFVGKSGVRHSVQLHDRRVARVMRRCRELPGQELFQYVDAEGAVHRIDSSDVNAWLAEAVRTPAGRPGPHVTAKDFRTWHGSVLALALTLEACEEGAVPCRPAQVLDAVARRLGNTPAVCRKAYVHPRVLALGMQLGSEEGRAALRRAAWARVQAGEGGDTGAPTTGLSDAERQLLALLRSRAAGHEAGPTPAAAAPAAIRRKPRDGPANDQGAAGPRRG